MADPRLQRLRPIRQGAPVNRNLELSPGIRLMNDNAMECYVLVDKQGNVLGERAWLTVNRWRKEGQTMSYVARRLIRERNMSRR